MGAILFLRELIERLLQWKKTGEDPITIPVGAIIAPTHEIAVNVSLTKLKEVFEQLDYGKFLGTWKYKATEHKLYLSSGATVLIKSATNPRSIEGFTADAIWADEAGQFADIIYSRMQDRVEKRQGRILITTTPYEFNWLYRDIWIPIKEKNQKVFRTELITWRTEDNFVRYNYGGKIHTDYYYDKEWLREIKATSSPEEYKLRYEASYETPSNLIYKLDREVDIRPRSTFPRMYNEVWQAFDYGFNHPMALLDIGYVDGTYYIFDEFIMSGVPILPDKDEQDSLSAKTIIEEHRFKYNIQLPCYGDQAAQAAMKQLREAGIFMMNANKSDNSVWQGIWLLQGLFSQHRIVIAEECARLISQLRNYHRKTDSYGVIGDVIYKVDDDGPDALRYGIYSHKPIEKSGSQKQSINLLDQIPNPQNVDKMFSSYHNDEITRLINKNTNGVQFDLDIHGVDNSWYSDNPNPYNTPYY